MERDVKTLQVIAMTLWCEVCKTWTKHVLNASKTHLVCGCGEQVYFFCKTVAPVEVSRLENELDYPEMRME